MVQEIIHINRLTRTFGDVTALAEVSLTVNRGEFLALLGPSGCGKTTLLRIIAGFLAPTTGTVSIDGQAMKNVPPHRRPVNTVFQNYALFPHMDVNENIAFGLKRKRVNKSEINDRVKDALAMVDMEKFASRWPSELSGGQQQRVALARAIVNQPQVILLDEPLAALDLKLRKKMQIELKRLHERLGMTFVLVTHDQDEALMIADRIVVMDHGQISQIGTGQDVYNFPANRFVANFIGDANLIPVALANSGVEPHPLVVPNRFLSEIENNATIMVRPEHISVDQSVPDDWVIGNGVLRQTIFLGAVWRSYVAIGPNHEIIIDSRDESATLLAPGEVVRFGWPIDKCRVLAR